MMGELPAKVVHRHRGLDPAWFHRRLAQVAPRSSSEPASQKTTRQGAQGGKGQLRKTGWAEAPDNSYNTPQFVTVVGQVFHRFGSEPLPVSTL